MLLNWVGWPILGNNLYLFIKLQLDRLTDLHKIKVDDGDSDFCIWGSYDDWEMLIKLCCGTNNVIKLCYANQFILMLFLYLMCFTIIRKISWYKSWNFRMRRHLNTNKWFRLRVASTRVRNFAPLKCSLRPYSTEIMSEN